jgi:poly(3-hydroxybutyrate) depolymerase
LLEIHGTDDRIVDYEGTGQFSAVQSVADWADLAGCSQTTTAASQPTSMLDTTCITYEGCPDDVEVTLCTVQDGGHCWFGNDSCGTGAGAIGAAVVGPNAEGIVNADAVWGFLSRFHCQTCGI